MARDKKVKVCVEQHPVMYIHVRRKPSHAKIMTTWQSWHLTLSCQHSDSCCMVGCLHHVLGTHKFPYGTILLSFYTHPEHLYTEAPKQHPAHTHTNAAHSHLAADGACRRSCNAILGCSATAQLPGPLQCALKYMWLRHST